MPLPPEDRQGQNLEERALQENPKWKSDPSGMVCSTAVSSYYNSYWNNQISREGHGIFSFNIFPLCFDLIQSFCSPFYPKSNQCF